MRGLSPIGRHLASETPLRLLHTQRQVLRFPRTVRTSSAKLQITVRPGIRTRCTISRRRYDLGYEEIVAANPGDRSLAAGGRYPDRICPRSSCSRTVTRDGLVLNLASMRLVLLSRARGRRDPRGDHPSHRHRPAGMGDAGGRVSHSPRKMEQPTWTVPASVLRGICGKGRAPRAHRTARARQSRSALMPCV